MIIADVVQALHEIAPPALAEPWDNVGLLLGDPGESCSHALVALEVTPALLRRAGVVEAQLLITHHPPIFQPLSRITADAPAASLVLQAARAGLALAAAHTNYDVAPGGVSHVLAGQLGLVHLEPLSPSERAGQAKIIVFTPEDDVEAVLGALDRSGAGVIGNYRQCSFRTPGMGTFLPVEGARPTIGRVGQPEEVQELRIEAVVPQALAPVAAAAVREAHSYEEPAIDVYPLQHGQTPFGLGLCGDLPRPVSARRLVSRIKKALGISHARVAGDLRRRVRRVAVCGGSGGKLVGAAVASGAELYLTGEVGHHEALEGADSGMVVVNAGHAPTEAPAIPALAERLRGLCPDVTFTVSAAGARGPFRTV
jgi:dinuclear metal center YbgI/SA1388 family protein